MKKFFIFAVLILSGCGGTYFCNYSDSTRNYNNDYALCENFANSTSPQIFYPMTQSSQNQFGTVTGVDQYGNVYNGTYQQLNNSNSTLNDINNLNSALATINSSLSNFNKFNECIYKLGWRKVSKGEYLAYLRYGYRKFTPEEGRNFETTLRNIIPEYYQLTKQQQDNLHKKVRKWILSKPEEESVRLFGGYVHTRNPYDFKAVLEQYKQENGLPVLSG